VPEWQALLDAFQATDRHGTDRRFGFVGLSMGAAIGVPLLAVEPRISAAVLGLVGHDAHAKAAPRVTVPLQFLLQWDDELVPRDSGLALFDAFGSRDKTLHANPGRHVEVPVFEAHDSAWFFTRHLSETGASP
jgi:dienelactone hydrolase